MRQATVNITISIEDDNHEFQRIKAGADLRFDPNVQSTHTVSHMLRQIDQARATVLDHLNMFEAMLLDSTNTANAQPLVSPDQES